MFEFPTEDRLVNTTTHGMQIRVTANQLTEARIPTKSPGTPGGLCTVGGIYPPMATRG